MTFIVAPLAMADPFQHKNIPAESQWHLHGDLTGLRKTNTGGFLLDQIRKGEADTIIDIETLRKNIKNIEQLLKKLKTPKTLKL